MHPHTPTTILSSQKYRLKKTRKSCDRPAAPHKKITESAQTTPPHPFVDRSGEIIIRNVTNRLRAHDDVCSRLEAHEAGAREIYVAALQSLQFPPIRGCLKYLLENTIIPALVRIGFDELLAKALFQMALPAWQQMGPISKDTVWFDPKVMRDVAEVRQGLLLGATREHAAPFWSASTTPQEVFRIVKNSMDPANLLQLLEEITTSWIILPRAFSLLQKDDCRYLPEYLNLIDEKPNDECVNIFIRIVIEFIANFSLRFAGDLYPQDRIRQLVVFGFATMFWKNLRSPPSGFEDVRIFEHFLRWLKFSHNKLGSLDREAEKSIKTMQAIQATVFPSGYGFQGNNDNRHDVSRFLIALRHGCTGIMSATQYFAIGPMSVKHAAGLSHTPMLFVLKSLLQQIKRSYPRESKRTQYFILEFLHQLKSAYEKTSRCGGQMEGKYRENFRSIQNKVLSMIREFRQAI